MTRPELLQQIDRIEAEMTRGWHDRELADVQERCMRAREKQLPLTWRERVRGLVQRAWAVVA